MSNVCFYQRKVSRHKEALSEWWTSPWSLFALTGQSVITVSFHEMSEYASNPERVCPLSATTFWGVVGVFAGASPSCLWARAGYSLDKSPAQGNLDMQFSSARSWDLNQLPSNHLPTCSSCWAGISLLGTLIFLFFFLFFFCSEDEMCHCSILWKWELCQNV